MLKLDLVNKSFGGIKALQNLRLNVSEGVIFGLIGPNGSGKTTVVNTLTGLYKIDSGHISWNNKFIENLAPNVISRLGISRTFQNLRLFPSLTVEQNIRIGQAPIYKSASTWLSVFGSPESQQLADDVQSLAQLLGIDNSLSLTANSLSFGDQKRLEIARALAGRPKLLILDEPAGGMNPSEVKTLSETLRKIQKTGVTILLIEHNMKLVMGTCQQIAVLNFGELICEGSPEQVKSDARVLEAYLGYSQ